MSKRLRSARNATDGEPMIDSAPGPVVLGELGCQLRSQSVISTFPQSSEREPMPVRSSADCQRMR